MTDDELDQQFPDPTKTETPRAANRLELEGGGVQISYSRTSISGQPLFGYHSPEGDLVFAGTEIDTLHSALGEEVTVTLANVPDLHTITLTLLLPPINTLEDGDMEFETLAIMTTNHTTITGPPTGATQTYEAVALRGLAKAVNF